MTESSTADTGSPKRGRKAKAADAPRQQRARAVGDMLPDVGRASFRRFGFVQSSVVTRWAEIVGPRYAGVSAPESIRFPQGRRADGVLTLMVEGAHAAMMQHVAPEIVERVNRFFGYPAVARVAIRQGAAGAVGRNAAEPRRAPPSLKPVPVELGDSLRTIADPELRACLESLAGALAATQGAPVFDDGKKTP
jgi:hypothetical protein